MDWLKEPFKRQNIVKKIHDRTKITKTNHTGENRQFFFPIPKRSNNNNKHTTIQYDIFIRSRTKINSLIPIRKFPECDTNTMLKQKEEKQTTQIEKQTQIVPSFEINETVWYLSKPNAFVNKVAAIIHKKISALVYEIKINGNRRTAHIKQLRKRVTRKITSADTKCYPAAVFYG